MKLTDMHPFPLGRLWSRWHAFNDNALSMVQYGDYVRLCRRFGESITRKLKPG